MNSLWEVKLRAADEAIKWKDVRLVHDPSGSAYGEVSMPFLNQEEFYGEGEVGINTYFRFYSIFKNIFGPEQEKEKELRTSLTNVLLHMLAENDVRQGMIKEEYYMKFLALDIKKGIFGERTKAVFDNLSPEKKAKVISGWIRTYKTGSSLAIFTDIVKSMIDDSIVYRDNKSPDEILIYTKLRRTEQLERELELVTDLFLDIRYHVEFFYEHHFGIIGIDQTMEINEIAIY